MSESELAYHRISTKSPYQKTYMIQNNQVQALDNLFQIAVNPNTVNYFDTSFRQSTPL